MDKINTSGWDNYFGHTEQTLVHACERYTETTFGFSEERLASGNIKVIATPGMMLTELFINTDKLFQMSDTQSGESAESLFILKGDVESRFYNLKNPLCFGAQNHSIQYNKSFTGDHIIHPGGFHALTISYEPGFLNNLLLGAESGYLQQLSRGLEKKMNFIPAPYSLTWQGRIADVIQSIRNCPFQGRTRYLFIESKMMELFVLQMEHFQAFQPATPRLLWNKPDTEKFFAVKEYIEAAYLEPLTLKELTYKFGLNEFKLKKGYKQFFQTTVFGHIHTMRMQKAKHLLREQDMSVSEVAYYIGYNNVSSFSSEFKKRFGYNPSLRH